jgi:hypothetical protein
MTIRSRDLKGSGLFLAFSPVVYLNLTASLCHPNGILLDSFRLVSSVGSFLSSLLSLIV